ncbi:MAG: thiolase family protein [Myxococcaceae bacterium]|nr:thiolase family protein [Myxococcaceae bacterium]
MSAPVYIADAVRTPIGRFKGALSAVRPDDLAAIAIKALLARTGVEGAKIEEAFFGCANQAGEDNRNVARMAVLLAGLPDAVPAATVNRLCGSGLEAIVQAARMVQLGEADVVLAGGVESMTRAPWSVPKPPDGFPTGKWEMFDTSLGWRYPNPKLAALFPLEQMGETAENVAEQWKVSRADQDAFALESHQKAVAAQKAGAFAAELVPVEIAAKKGPATVVSADEGPRADSTLEKLSGLRPAFREGGTVTAGNSSTLNDGAAAVLVMSEKAVNAWGKKPLGRYVSSGTAGVDARVMGVGPVPASKKALFKAGWQASDLDLIELNEAFAAQSLACVRDLELDPKRVNVNGGAIALGHPLGMSGARIVATLLHAMRARAAKKGLATMCIGVGQGIAATFEGT